jgi:hypothetical protein
LGCPHFGQSKTAIMADSHQLHAARVVVFYSKLFGPDSLINVHSHFFVRAMYSTFHNDPSLHKTASPSCMGAIWVILRSFMLLASMARVAPLQV